MRCVALSRLEKFLDKLYRRPIPTDIRYEDAARFLQSIGCRAPKNKGTSHSTFIHPDFPEQPVGLMKGTLLRKYQIEEMKKLISLLGIYREEDEDGE
jgi:hypothetical protein